MDTLARLLRFAKSSGAILCGHGIADEGSPIHVSVEQLENAIDLARVLGSLVPLTDLVSRYRSGRSTAGLFALTFDDGYESLRAAVPILTRHDVPATVFLVSSATRSGAPFWWDRLDAASERSTQDARAEFLRSLSLPADAGHSARDELLARYRGRSHPSLDAALDQLEAVSAAVTKQRPMTFGELEDLSDGNMLEFGVHTQTHALLPLLDSDEVREEIRECYNELKEHLDSRVVPILAAPFGLYDERTQPLAREAGMDAVLSLNQVTLASRPASGTVPRISLSRKQAPWKLALKLTGLVDAREVRRGALKNPYVPGQPRMLWDDVPDSS